MEVREKATIRGDIEIGGKMILSGNETLNGRAEFSDGSYMEFKNGVLVGGYTTEGGEIR